MLKPLINEWNLPDSLNEYDKYKYFKNEYLNGNTYLLLNNVNVFGPYPEPEKSWDISKAQKIAIYNPEVTSVLNWIKTRIIINLASIDYGTLHVLIRIATGMLNKCDIPKEYQIMFHDNMVDNLNKTYNNIILSSLPF